MQHNFNFDKHQNLNFRCTFKFKLTYVREEAARVEKSMNSNWTVPVWEKLAEFKQDLGRKHEVHEVIRLKFSSVIASKSVAEDLQAFKAHIKKLFRLPTYDETVLGLLDERVELSRMDELPDATCTCNASRRLKCKSGGEDGSRAEHLRAVCRHRVGRVNLFFGFVAKCTQEWWLHGHENEVPNQWGACKTSMLFKKGDASNPGNYRSIVMLTVTQKLALAIVGDRLQWLIESLGAEHEEQNGFCRNRGGTDAVFNLRVGCKKRQEHGLETV